MIGRWFGAAINAICSLPNALTNWPGKVVCDTRDVVANVQAAVKTFSAARATFIIPVIPVVRDGNNHLMMYGYKTDLLPQRNAKGVIIFKAARTRVFADLNVEGMQVAYTCGGMTSGTGAFYKRTGYRTYGIGGAKAIKDPGLYILLTNEELGKVECAIFRQV
jgi:hypothetical protein